MTSCKFIRALLVVVWLNGCKEASVSPRSAPPAGEQTMIVTAHVYDEFERERESAGLIIVTLSGADRIVHGSIPAGSASLEFHGLPLESYLVSASKDGFYPYETIAGARTGTSNWSPSVNLYPHPSPAFRIDSIAVAPDPASSKQLRVMLFTARTAPSSYAWRAIIYYSASPSIDPSGGRYDQAESISQTGGGNTIMSTAMKSTFTGYPFLGKRVYVTARLMTPATRNFFDSTLQKSIYTNLEANTSVVASFIP